MPALRGCKNRFFTLAQRKHSDSSSVWLWLGLGSGRRGGLAGDRIVFSPIANGIPIVSEQFAGVLAAAGAITAFHGVGTAIKIASPADAFGMLRMQRKFLAHDE